MKLIEALKQIKDLQRKAEDLRGMVAANSAHLSYETPMYPDQKAKVDSWLQSHSDILKEISRLRVAIQRTNLETPVMIQLNGVGVEKSIAEWIHRRRDLADLECKAWKSLTDRGLREGIANQSTGQQVEVKIVRCYDPSKRDEKIMALSSEPTTIDSTLEIVNAVTDLIE